MSVRLAALAQGEPVRLAVTLVVFALALIYLPDIGHGFLRDDFMWVRAARVETSSDLRRIFTENVGFYRPLVTTTFAVNRAMFGLRPLPYALTNFALLLVCMWLIVRVAGSVGLGPPFALTAAALWSLNFHGVNMALLWISGRTALLLCAFSLAALAASLRGRWWWTAGWSLLAMLSKEEAIVLPFVLVCWRWYLSEDRRLSSILDISRKALPVFGALAAYLFMRGASGAFGPLNAPDYYRFTFEPSSVARNVAEYVDRSCAIVAIVLLLTLVLVQTRPTVSRQERRTLLLCALWLISGFALTVFLPIRSSLYALFPSIGSCLAGGVLMQAFHRVAPDRVRMAWLALVVLAFALVPVYRARNDRWVAPADLSRRLVADLRTVGASIPDNTRLLAVDEDASDGGLRSVFDGLFADAVLLYVGRGVTGQLVDPATGAIDAHDVVLRLRSGALVAQNSWIR